MVEYTYMSKNTANGKIAQKKGREAELRVEKLCQNLGLETCTSQQLDYRDKVDVAVEGRGFQVSCSQKSQKTIKGLERRGICNIYAGEQVDDEQLQEQIIEGMDYPVSFPVS